MNDSATKKTTDVVIAGGGIVGLSTALELASSGLQVIVVERGHVMGEASWAAAGMLAARDPENPSALRALSELSLKLYPGYLELVERLSGLRVPLRTHQTLQGSRMGRRFKAIEDRTILQSEAAEKLVPGLDGEGREFLLLDEDSLAPRDLCAALPLAAKAAGVTVLESTAVTNARSTSDGVEVETQAGTLVCQDFVNCCGAWAGQTPTDGASLATGLEPRKGQILTVKLEAGPGLNCVLRTPETYLVPRGDGHIVIGATVERTGFDKVVDEHAIDKLFEEACVLWPELRSARRVETWAGLRPGSSDSLPVMGALDQPHCWIAAGHFRNGILLAPATARVMRQMITGVAPDVPVEAFGAQRFGPQRLVRGDNTTALAKFKTACE